MTSAGNQISAAEKLQIHQALVNRIVTRAVAEGSPLSNLELQQLASDSMPKDQYRAFAKEFGRENEWQVFLERISGLLRSAIDEDAVKDPQAPARYNAMVHQIEDRPESFTLWACSVPAISGYKSQTRWEFADLIVSLLVIAVIIYVVLHVLKVV